ncbi:MAG: methylated-DNA--[protein]-cysteine S-methyltransferase [Acidimicrobiales bacterium]
MTMTATMLGATDQWTAITTPVGEMMAVGDDDALHFLHLPDSFDVSALDRDRRGAPASVALTVEQVDAYFAGTLADFSLPLDPAGTAFQRQVWMALAAIGYGETESYGQVAARIGRPKACRAVGLANGRNPIPLVLPCHRVIGADGSLTGYGGGLTLKQQLLDHERATLARGVVRRRAS